MSSSEVVKQRVGKIFRITKLKENEHNDKHSAVLHETEA
jgi:hypothetical protein